MSSKSKAKKTPKEPNESQDNSGGVKMNLPWTEKDKVKLLAALNKYGPNDINSIAQEFPKKTASTVKNMITKILLIAKKNIMWKENQINTWLESGLFEEPAHNIIPEVLKLISLVEHHPSPHESGGCDYKEIYEVLAKVTSGEMPENVSHKTLEMIGYAMKEITVKIWPKEKNEVDLYLENLVEERQTKKYERKKY